MNFTEQILQKLFPNKHSAPQKEEVVHAEELIRDYSFMHQYNTWKKNPELSLFLNDLKESFLLAKSGAEGNMILGLHQTKYANGFVLYFSKAFSPQKFTFLIEFIAEKTLTLGYKTSDCSKRYISKGDDVKEIERYYLKPKNGNSLPLNQQYGNILIERIEKNGEPKYIKLLASIYSDRNYQEAKPFEDYMTKITSL